MRLVWEWTQANKKEQLPPHPILSMAEWLFDPIATRETGIDSFRLPYPGGTWLEEKRNNEQFLFLMRLARKTARVGWKVKHDKKLDSDENKFLEEIAEAI